ELCGYSRCVSNGVENTLTTLNSLNATSTNIEVTDAHLTTLEETRYLPTPYSLTL
ncbi:hypothetical protein Csa_015538, partial [Cucumis sativus]